jgi:nucleotide-binding universal stress UspA family protein
VVSSQGAVVVGVDGSRAALNAVRWAVDEAVSRDVTLRLVHADTGGRHTEAGGLGCDTALLDAEDAAIQIRPSVRLQSARVVGRPVDVLVGESKNASMVCVGARPPRCSASQLLGETASGLAKQADCPVAIIRSRLDGSARTEGVVSVVLSDDADNDEVLHLAMQEGRLRRSTVRQIDRRIDSWVRRYPDVPVETVASGTPRQCHDDPSYRPDVGLAVVGKSDADQIASMSVPNCHPIVGYPDCSVLLVRH